MGSNPATPTILLLEFKGFILNGAAVSDTSKEERKGVESPAADAKVPRLFAGRSRRGQPNLFWHLAAVFAVVAPTMRTYPP